MIDNSDTALLQEQLLGFASLTAPQLTSADLNADGAVDIADLMTIITFLDSPGAFFIESSPADGETGVALTWETIIRFSAPLDPATVNAGSISAEFGGLLLAARVYLSLDQSTVTLFYDEPLPERALVRVSIDGRLLGDASGRAVDVNGGGGGGEPGGSGGGPGPGGSGGGGGDPRGRIGASADVKSNRIVLGGEGQCEDSESCDPAELAVALVDCLVIYASVEVGLALSAIRL